VGRARGSQFEELARLSRRYGSSEERLTIGQNAIIPSVRDDRLTALLEEPLLRTWRSDPSEPARGTVSCTGKDFCSLALIETKEYALELVQALEKRVRGHNTPVTIHWSGCPAGCGNHQVSDIGLQGRRTRIGGEIVDAVDIFVGGSSGPNAVPGVKVMENVPCKELPQVAEFLLRYGDFRHLREQLLSLGGAAAEAEPESLVQSA
jgi:ferredoxin-nitrite reductase